MTKLYRSTLCCTSSSLSCNASSERLHRPCMSARAWLSSWLAGSFSRSMITGLLFAEMVSSAVFQPELSQTQCKIRPFFVMEMKKK